MILTSNKLLAVPIFSYYSFDILNFLNVLGILLDLCIVGVLEIQAAGTQISDNRNARI